MLKSQPSKPSSRDFKNSKSERGRSSTSAKMRRVCRKRSSRFKRSSKPETSSESTRNSQPQKNKQRILSPFLRMISPDWIFAQTRSLLRVFLLLFGIAIDIIYFLCIVLQDLDSRVYMTGTKETDI